MPPVARRKVTAASLGEARHSAVFHFQGELGADDVAVTSANQLDPEPVVFRPRFIVQERDWLVEVANDEVDAAVVVDVAEGDAPTIMLLLEVRPTLGGDGLEATL